MHSFFLIALSLLSLSGIWAFPKDNAIVDDLKDKPDNQPVENPDSLIRQLLDEGKLIGIALDDDKTGKQKDDQYDIELNQDKEDNDEYTDEFENQRIQNQFPVDDENDFSDKGRILQDELNQAKYHLDNLARISKDIFTNKEDENVFERVHHASKKNEETDED